jgi:glycosyltransferase involved in cell wall biosynthesis
MNSPLACTIIANNYLAYARAFTRSFLAQHPDGQVSVLIVDRPQPGHRYEDEPFAVTFADQLGIPGFPHFAFRYSLLELNTAVKPYFLLHLHRTLGCDRICYFDPDILVLGDLSELYARLGEADAVLTPHLTAPLEDAAVPSEREILLSGVYNLGFLGIAFNPRTFPFLDWWSRRLYRECLHEIERGLFVDQRWMDLAPAFLERAEILRDPGYNAAYWNLAHRRIEPIESAAGGGGWLAGGAPLRFFHFSGFDFARPEMISKFQNRFTFAERPDVLPLFELYAARVRAEGQEVVRGYPYGYGRFDNGAAVPEIARQILRQVDPEGRRWPDPFATAGGDTFFDWLAQPADGSPAALPIPRLALALWDHRPDLKSFFPHPWGVDAVRFAHWFADSTGAPERIDPAFTAGLAAPLRRAGEVAREDVVRAEQAQADLTSLLERPAGRPPLSAAEISWLTADAGYEPGRRPRVPRLALEMHRRRPDLLRAHPDPLGADRLGIALWYVTYGRKEYLLPPEVVLPVARTLPWRQRAWARVWWERHRRQQQRRAQRAPEGAAEPADGTAAASPAAASLAAAPERSPFEAGPVGLSVIGWATAPTGVGEACRGSLAALDRAGIPRALWVLDGRADGAPGAASETERQGLPYDPLLFHVNADMMETVLGRIPSALHFGRHRIGYWFWELAHFPLGLAGAFRCVDEVWAPTRFCQEAFRTISPVEVRWVPPCVVPPLSLSAPSGDGGDAAPQTSREELGAKPDDYLFCFAFDALSVPERKNPAGLLAAFARVARGAGRPVRLLLKVNHAEAEPEYLAELHRRAAGLPVTFLTCTLSRQALDGMLAACDAYVSLHRSEGLGLPLIEAMYLGKPVIATGYGGVTDFLDDSTGFVVRHRPVALASPQGPYPAGAVWAEPDVEHAAALMRALADTPESAAARVAAARRRVRELYAPEAAGERLKRELERIAMARGELQPARQSCEDAA